MNPNQDLRAAMYSDAELGEVMSCLHQGADASLPLHHGSCPLLEATTVEVAAALLEHGANIDAEDDYGRGVLHALAYTTQARAMANLYQGRGANPEIRDVDGRTALLHCLASPQGSKAAPLALLAIGANSYATDAQGNNALHCWAQGRADISTGQRLLEVGVDATARNRLGQSVSDLLCENLHGERILAQKVLGSHFECLELQQSTPGVSLHSSPRRV